MTCCCKISETTWCLICFFTNFNLNENLLDRLSEAEVKSRYRFSLNSIQFITDTLAADLGRNHALKPQEQVLVALHFFGSGSFFGGGR